MKNWCQFVNYKRMSPSGNHLFYLTLVSLMSVCLDCSFKVRFKEPTKGCTQYYGQNNTNCTKHVYFSFVNPFDHWADWPGKVTISLSKLALGKLAFRWNVCNLSLCVIVFSFPLERSLVLPSKIPCCNVCDW